MAYGRRIVAGVNSYNSPELDRLLEEQERARTQSYRWQSTLRGLPADQQNMAVSAREGSTAQNTNRLRSASGAASARLGQIRASERESPGRRLGGGGSTGLERTDATGYGRMLAEQLDAANLEQSLAGRGPMASTVDTRVSNARTGMGGGGMPGYWEEQRERERQRQGAQLGQSESLKTSRSQRRSTDALGAFRESQARGYDQQNRLASDPRYRAMQARADTGMDRERAIEEARLYVGARPETQMVDDATLPMYARRQQQGEELEQIDRRYSDPWALRGQSTIDRAAIQGTARMGAAEIGRMGRNEAAAITQYGNVARSDFPVPGADGSQDSLMAPYLRQLERFLPTGESYVDVDEAMRLIEQQGGDPRQILQRMQVYGIELR